MNNDRKIKIVIGVTGHRDIREDDTDKLKSKVCEYLLGLKNKYRHTNIVMLNSLATGADTICAEVALELGIELICPLPMSVSEYEKDFNKNELDIFHNLLNKCKKVFVVPSKENDTRDILYRNAGIYVSDKCNILLSIWDGEINENSNCGTYGIIEYTKNRILSEKVYEDIITPIYHIQIGRKTNDVVSTFESKYLNDYEVRFDDIDEYNADCIKQGCEGGYSLVPKGKFTELKQIDEAYMMADILSQYYQKKYFHTMLLFAIASVIIVISYLLYDEMGLLSMLIVYPLAGIVYYIFYYISNRFKYHKKYYSYRVLAEALRVQFFLLSIGVKENICRFFTWTQKYDLNWIEDSIKSILAEKEYSIPNISIAEIKKIWIDEQLKYHLKKAKQKDSKNMFRGNVTNIMMIGTIILFIITFTLEFRYKGALGITFVGIEMGVLLKVAWGILAAITLFVSNYYGKFSLDRQVTDHRKMAKLYENANLKISNKNNDTKSILIELAKEEIIENGEWMSYVVGNSLDFSI